MARVAIERGVVCSVIAPRGSGGRSTGGKVTQPTRVADFRQEQRTLKRTFFVRCFYAVLTSRSQAWGVVDAGSGDLADAGAVDAHGEDVRV